MVRITIRNLPDIIHQQLTAAAEQHQRSMEAEIRFALQQYVADLQRVHGVSGVESTRQRWQRQTGQRIARLFVRLRQDGAFDRRERHDVPHLARTLGEASPANLLDCIDGVAAPSFDLLRRISLCFHCSESWLLSGAGTMFLWENIGDNYRAFLSAEQADQAQQLRLIRLCGGRLDGMMLCIWHDKMFQHFICGYIREAFPQESGFSADAAEKLCAVIRYLKTQRGKCQMAAYDFRLSDTLTELGDHHPRYFMQQTATSAAEWLNNLFEGQDPADWFSAFPPLLKALTDRDDNEESDDGSWAAID